MQVLIVGGGVIGLLTALELSRAGCRVVVLDQAQHGQAASWAGGGILSPLYPWRYLPAVNRLANLAPMLYSTLAIELLEATGIDIEIHRSGMLILDTEDQRDALAWALDQPQEPPELLERPQMLQLNPRLNPKFERGLWCKHVANIRNPHLVKALVKHLDRQSNVTLVRHTSAQQFEWQGDQVRAVIDQQGQRWHADQIVIASGAWSGQLAELIGLQLPIQPIKGQMILFKAATRWLPSMIMQRGVYLIPRMDGHILCGSTLENVGFDTRVDDQARQHLYHQAIELVPALAGLPIKDQWAGVRPAAPNGVPYIGRAPQFRNLWVNSGHFRNGIVLAPASARLLREQMLGDRPSLPINPYQFSEHLQLQRQQSLSLS